MAEQQNNPAKQPGNSQADEGFRLHVLASGSKGNAAIVQAGNQAVLIDCGITKKAFFERCTDVGFDPSCIQAVIVTHEHIDHTKGIGVVMRGLAKLGVQPEIYCTPGTYFNSRELAELQGFDVYSVHNTSELMIGGIHVQLFPTSHDAADPVGMAFETSTAHGRDMLGYLTDSGVLPEAATKLFADARILALESNHDLKMLEEGPYPYHLKLRVASDFGHLSNRQSAEALERIAPSKLQVVCGMHLSETNNLHRLAVASLESDTLPYQALAAWQNKAISIG